MAKNTPDNTQSSTSNQSGPFSSSNTTTSGKSNSLLLIGAIIVIVVIIIGIAYYAITKLSSGSSTPTSATLNSISNSSLNQTAALFLTDLKNSQYVSALHVTYFESNATIYSTPPGANYSIAITSNQTVQSYKLNDYNRTDVINLFAYTNTKDGDVLSENVSDIEYYNSNTTIICFNQTTYELGAKTNSSLQCESGDGGESFIEQFPFTADNITAFAFVIDNATYSLKYVGTETYIGRSCDDFIISNETTSNLLTNYSAFSMCLDHQYGVPLYFNATEVVGGIPNSTVYTATALSTNVTASDFVIPQAYLDNVSHSII